jgi:phospholipid/cholesterol/gamma-HCH transport system substrate-binding protein
MTNQLKLGIFTALGLFAIIVSIIATGTFSLKKTYNIYVTFDNISGLSKKAKVKIAGVDVGVLRKSSLENNSKAKLKLSINRKIILYKNSCARIISIGIIGTKYIEIIPGDPNFPILEDGDCIASIQNLLIEDILTNITNNINKALSNEKSANIMENFADVIYLLKDILNKIATENSKITKTVENFNQFSTELANITKHNKQSFNDTIASMKNISSKLEILVSRICNGKGVLPTIINDEQMAANLKSTVISAKETIKTINETLSKADKLKLNWNYTLRYDTKTEKAINDVGITMVPSNNKFYYIGISNVADNNSIINYDENKSVNKLEALLGFRLKKYEIYAGMIRGRAGIGIGYSFFQPIYIPYKTLQIHLNISDFAMNNTSVPYINLSVRAGLLKWFFAGIILEDIACKTATFSPYLKIEVDDKDLAALFKIVNTAISIVSK